MLNVGLRNIFKGRSSEISQKIQYSLSNKAEIFRKYFAANNETFENENFPFPKIRFKNKDEGYRFFGYGIASSATFIGMGVIANLIPEDMISAPIIVTSAMTMFLHL
jgi:hypothetical protein